MGVTECSGIVKAIFTIGGVYVHFCMVKLVRDAKYLFERDQRSVHEAVVDEPLELNDRVLDVAGVDLRRGYCR